MIRIDKAQKTLVKLSATSLAKVGLQERGDIQRMIVNNPQAFMEEMGEEFMLIAEELPPCDQVADRLDLLAIDPYGAVVVIELKRNDDKLQLLQSLTYASMIAAWEPTKFIEKLMQFEEISEEQARTQLEEFVESIEQINQVQRIVLVAEDFDYCVLATAEWLRENYEVDIRCYKIQVAAEGSSLFLSCNCIFPSTGITEQAVRRGNRVGTSRVYKTWDEVLEPVENKAVVNFFKQETAGGQENRLKTDPQLKYRVEDRKRWSVSPRQKLATVWQGGRFTNDESFWKSKLGETADVRQVNKQQSLSFSLFTPEQFAAFKAAATKELASTEFKE